MISWDSLHSSSALHSVNLTSVGFAWRTGRSTVQQPEATSDVTVLRQFTRQMKSKEFSSVRWENSLISNFLLSCSEATFQAWNWSPSRLLWNVSTYLSNCSVHYHIPKDHKPDTIIRTWNRTCIHTYIHTYLYHFVGPCFCRATGGHETCQWKTLHT